MPTPMVVDTGTASDDAVALIMALRDPAVEVVAITVVAGNVPLAQASHNARYAVELCAPDIASKVGRCVAMGGAACTVGNVTPAAEYNVWCDPEAARACFRSRLPIEMVGWEVSRGAANLDDGDIDRCRALA
jgi:inosine-uridine nucleoside N-ribohydrolase